MRELIETTADPFVRTGVLALATSVATQLLLRRYPQWRLAGHVILLATMTVVFLRNGILPYTSTAPDSTLLQRVSVGFAKIVWWINAAWALIGVVRVFLVLERRPREGRLAQDLVVGLIYVGATLSVVAYVFDAPVGTLFATSGVLAIILGLALQSTLGDVFSGIALNLSRSYDVGDRVVLEDGTAGRVIETNWRAIHLINDTNDLVILPNSNLAKARLTNVSRPGPSQGAKVSVRIAPSVAPSAIAEVLRTALAGSITVLVEPKPSVVVRSMDADAIEFELSYRVADLGVSGQAATEIFDLVYRHTLAAGFRLAPPHGGGCPRLAEDAGQHDRRPTPNRLLDALPLFAKLTEEERNALAAKMIRRSFKQGDVLAEQDAILHELRIIRSGTVTMIRNEGTQSVELERLAPGDCFGERGLLIGAGEPATIRALTPVIVYALGQESIGTLLRERPSIADDLGLVLSRRAEHRKLLSKGPREESTPEASSLILRIRRLFSVPDAEQA